ncbi:MAG: peptidoglycan-associated lipoprotein Pal [Elusimicrobiota bacterium]
MALALCSCAAKRSVRKDGAKAGLTQSSSDIDGDSLLGRSALDPSVDVSEAQIRGKEFRDIQDLQTIRFDYDSYSLSDEARATLRTNSAYLKEHPDLEILVEGHCDDRGTLEYNLALGQKRAKSVREYYIRLGVSGKSLATLSFGEERPLCAEQTEACWGTNRRAASKIRAQVSSSDLGNGRSQ